MKLLLRQILLAFISPPVLGVLFGVAAVLVLNWLSLPPMRSSWWRVFKDPFIEQQLAIGGGVGLIVGFAVDAARRRHHRD